ATSVGGIVAVTQRVAEDGADAQAVRDQFDSSAKSLASALLPGSIVICRSLAGLYLAGKYCSSGGPPMSTPPLASGAVEYPGSGRCASISTSNVPTGTPAPAVAYFPSLITAPQVGPRVSPIGTKRIAPSANGLPSSVTLPCTCARSSPPSLQPHRPTNTAAHSAASKPWRPEPRRKSAFMAASHACSRRLWSAHEPTPICGVCSLPRHHDPASHFLT